MTFEEYQKSKGRNQSSEADFREYQQFMQQQGGGQAPQAQPQAQPQAPSPQGLQKAAAVKQLQVQAPKALAQAPAQAPAQEPKKYSAQSVLDAYKKDKVATQATMKSEDIDRSAKGLEMQKKKDAIEFPEQQPPADDSLTFKGDTKGVMAATSMGMQAVNAKNDMQAIMGGAGAGMQVASMLGGAAAGPVGIAVGAGTALMGMINSRKEKREAERKQKELEEKLKKQQKQAKELQLMQSQSSERQSAFSNLMSNL